jgi:L-ascorbate metabolism protein UlaG (beta-lactamase superfamily)
MKVTYFGHSCFMVEVKGKKLLFDPFISPNPLASHIKIEEILPDYILVSHGHEDHLADLVRISKQSNAMVIGVWELYIWASKQGLTNLHPMNTGGRKTFDFGTVQLVKAVHSSSFPDGSYAGNPVGFVIESEEGNFYYSGDTALTFDMQLIPKRTTLNFALFPIGSNFTMDAEDASKAADFVLVNKVIGLHYDTFEFIKIDHEEAKKIFISSGKELILLNIGETMEL